MNEYSVIVQWKEYIIKADGMILDRNSGIIQFRTGGAAVAMIPAKDAIVIKLEKN